MLKILSANLSISDRAGWFNLTHESQFSSGLVCHIINISTNILLSNDNVPMQPKCANSLVMLPFHVLNFVKKIISEYSERSNECLHNIQKFYKENTDDKTKFQVKLANVSFSLVFRYDKRKFHWQKITAKFWHAIEQR